MSESINIGIPSLSFTSPTISRKIIRECIHFFWETGNNKPTKFSKKRIRSLMATKEHNNKIQSLKLIIIFISLETWLLLL